MSRLLTNTEISGFLFRHPVIASRVAVTRGAIALGAYDVNVYDRIAAGQLILSFPGLIFPNGLQVSDSEYALVTIQPTNEAIWFSGWSPVNGDAEKEEYVSPSGNTPSQILMDALGTLSKLGIGLIGVYLVGSYLKGRK
jgi:hypothetical protein